MFKWPWKSQVVDDEKIINEVFSFDVGIFSTGEIDFSVQCNDDSTLTINMLAAFFTAIENGTISSMIRETLIKTHSVEFVNQINYIQAELRKTPDEPMISPRTALKLTIHSHQHNGEL